jgi:hypothetical protein
MSDTSSSPLLEELASIRDYLDAARAIARDGFMPDMSALEKRVADLCLGIQAADASAQKQCLPELAALLKNLDDCERDLRARHEAGKKTGAS